MENSNSARFAEINLPKKKTTNEAFVTLRNTETAFQGIQSFKVSAPTTRVPQDINYYAEDTTS